MKITNLKIVYYKPKISLTLDRPYPTFLTQRKIFIIIETSDGIIGYGEPSPYAGNEKDLLESIIKIFNDYLLNSNPLFFEKIYPKIKNIYKIDKSVFYASLAGINQAILDINSKIAQKPLYKFINNTNAQSRINLYASGGMIFENTDYNILLDEAISAQEQGFVGWKFRPKTPLNNPSHFNRLNDPPSFDVELLLKFCHILKKKVHKKFKLMIDFGKRISKHSETQYIFQILQDLEFFFIEEPIKLKLNEYLKLKNKFHKINIAAGESLTNYKDLTKWLNGNFLDIYQPDSNLIPLFDLIKTFSDNKYINHNFILHNWTYHINMLSNFHLAAAFNSIKIVEYSFIVDKYANDLIDGSLNIVGGKVILSNEYGLGIKLKKTITRNNILYESKKVF